MEMKYAVCVYLPTTKHEILTDDYNIAWDIYHAMIQKYARMKVAIEIVDLATGEIFQTNYD